MIGLQDEYASSKTHGDMTRQGVPKNKSASASIMSSGEIVEEAHYASILDALNTAVKPFNIQFGMR